MEIRLTGSPDECERTAHALQAVLDIHSMSRWHPNRGTPRLGRVYLDATPPHLIPTAPTHTGRKERR